VPVVVIRRPKGHNLLSSALPRFLLLYAAMYEAFGVASPFLPALVNARVLSAEPLGLVMGAGTAVRLLTATLAGRTGDAPALWSAAVGAEVLVFFVIGPTPDHDPPRSDPGRGH
jgi:hypothetical protein